MADEPNIAKEIWASRPKPFSSLFRGAIKGAPWGASVGLAVGGPPGAAIGAGVGAALGTITVASTRLTETLKRLTEVTRSLVDRYKAFDPIIARMHHQWRLLDRRMNRAWARTIAPTLKKLSDIGIEFSKLWGRLKIEFFEAVRPYLHSILNILKITMRGMMTMFSGLLKVLTGVIGGFTKLLRFLGLLPEEKIKAVTEKLKPFEMEWPTLTGPLTGAMRRAGIGQPPFTEEERREEKPEEVEEKRRPVQKRLSEMFPEGLPTGFGVTDSVPPKEKKEKPTGINVEVKVGDSKELTAVFERTWKQVAYELRKIETEEALRAFVLQQQGTFV